MYTRCPKKSSAFVQQLVEQNPFLGFLKLALFDKGKRLTQEFDKKQWFMTPGSQMCTKL